MLVLPILVGYLEAAEFSMRGRMVYAFKYNVPYYIMYLIIFAALICFLYLTSAGRDIVEQGGGLVGVLMGISMTLGLCQLAITLGYGVVRIPIKTLQSASVKKRYELAVYKVADHEDQILEVLHDKKHSILTLLYLANNMNVERELREHHDDMMKMIDDALIKTNEQQVKAKIITQADVDQDLIEEYNNGWIDLARL